MPELADKLEAARAEVARLERIAASATCAELGHDWVSLGGCNCGCHENAACSIPVNECRRCGECDYGDNDDARAIKDGCDCREPWPDVEEGFDAGEWNNEPVAVVAENHE